MTHNIYTLQEIDEKLKNCSNFLQDIVVILPDDSINKFSVAKYGDTQNIIILSNGLSLVRIFERITTDGFLVEGNTQNKTYWKEIE